MWEMARRCFFVADALVSSGTAQQANVIAGANALFPGAKRVVSSDVTDGGGGELRA
jgi:hypothetical protein